MNVVKNAGEATFHRCSRHNFIKKKSAILGSQLLHMLGDITQWKQQLYKFCANSYTFLQCSFESAILQVCEQ
jgi:hypothetical protein